MESEKAKLAILGHAPAFAAPLHVGRPNLGDRSKLHNRLDAILQRNWLTNQGPFEQEFEQRIADHIGVGHCVAICNGTVALEIAIRATELTGEVIVPGFTFVATAHALKWQDINPVFCDIDPQTHNIDPARIEELITPRTTGIIGVHLWGRPCPISELQEISDRNNLTLLFDAAHAFGCSDAGQMIGTFGRAEVLSFHATKFINAFEGGAVVTNDDELARKMRLMRNFGFAGYDDVIYPGTNGKLSEICAAMGLTSLDSLDEIVATNRHNFACYERELADLDGVSIISYDSAETCNYQYIVLDIDPSKTPLSRDELINVLHADHVLARRYFYPGCHRMEPYRSSRSKTAQPLPVTEDVCQRVMQLPTGTSIGEDHVRGIARIIRTAFENASVVRKAVAQLSDRVDELDVE